MKKDRRIFKTLAITFQPAAQDEGGQVTIDIGKYYDDNSVRVVKAWAYSLYRDITAGAVAQEGDCYFFLEGTTVMQLPAGAIVPASGSAVSSGSPMIPGDRNGEFNFLGDAVLENPVFKISITGVKRSQGSLPPEFKWIFYIVLQLEFNFGRFDDLEKL